MRRTLLVVCAVIVLAAALPTTAQTIEDGEFVPPDTLIPGWYARIETSMGRILAYLHPDQAPQSVAHFAGLAQGTLEWIDPVTGQAQKGHYYDEIQVHFAKAGHLFEAGDRFGTGRGAPEIWVPIEGASPRRFNRAGRLGMSSQGGGRVSGVVFFVTASPLRGPDGNSPLFGTVVSGLEVVQSIAQVRTYDNGRPIEPVTIRKIRIFSVGDPPALPEPKPHVPTRIELRVDEPRQP